MLLALGEAEEGHLWRTSEGSEIWELHMDREENGWNQENQPVWIRTRWEQPSNKVKRTSTRMANCHFLFEQNPPSRLSICHQPGEGQCQGLLHAHPTPSVVFLCKVQPSSSTFAGGEEMPASATKGQSAKLTCQRNEEDGESWGLRDDKEMIDLMWAGGKSSKARQVRLKNRGSHRARPFQGGHWRREERRYGYCHCDISFPGPMMTSPKMLIFSVSVYP